MLTEGIDQTNNWGCSNDDQSGSSYSITDL